MPGEHPFLAAARPKGDGAFAFNIMHFGRVLRAAGMRIGPGRILAAIEAVEAAGIRRRADLYWSLHTVLVSRTEEHELFDQAFRLFWNNPEQMTNMLEQLVGDEGPRGDKQESSEEVRRRVLDALLPERPEIKSERQALTEHDSSETFADTDVVKTMDFEAMTERELSEAKAIVANMRLPIASVRTRRLKAAPRGTAIDMRNTLRNTLRFGHAGIAAKLCKTAGTRAAPRRSVRYFGLDGALFPDRAAFPPRAEQRPRPGSQLRFRDAAHKHHPSAQASRRRHGARQGVGRRCRTGRAARGSGSCLKTFNKYWSRRVLGQGAVVLLITDGLDQNAGEGLSEEVERLHLSCRRLIWLNPLLRYEGFEPKSLGVRAILPHVDEFRPCIIWRRFRIWRMCCQNRHRRIGPGDGYRWRRPA